MKNTSIINPRDEYSGGGGGGGGGGGDNICCDTGIPQLILHCNENGFQISASGIWAHGKVWGRSGRSSGEDDAIFLTDYIH